MSRPIKLPAKRRAYDSDTETETECESDTASCEDESGSETDGGDDADMRLENMEHQTIPAARDTPSIPTPTPLTPIVPPSYAPSTYDDPFKETVHLPDGRYYRIIVVRPGRNIELYHNENGVTELLGATFDFRNIIKQQFHGVWYNEEEAVRAAAAAADASDDEDELNDRGSQSPVLRRRQLPPPPPPPPQPPSVLSLSDHQQQLQQDTDQEANEPRIYKKCWIVKPPVPFNDVVEAIEQEVARCDAMKRARRAEQERERRERQREKLDAKKAERAVIREQKQRERAQQKEAEKQRKLAERESKRQLKEQQKREEKAARQGALATKKRVRKQHGPKFSSLPVTKLNLDAAVKDVERQSSPTTDTIEE